MNHRIHQRRTPQSDVIPDSQGGGTLARRAETGRVFLIGGGAIYLVLWLYGLIIDHGSGANFVPVNTADDWLHFVLGVGMIAVGLMFGPRKRRS